MFLTCDIGAFMKLVFIISIVVVSALILMLYPFIKKLNVFFKNLLGIFLFGILFVSILGFFTS